MTEIVKQADEFLQLITDSEDGPPTQRSPLQLADPSEDFRVCQELRDTLRNHGLSVGKVHQDLLLASFFNILYPKPSDYSEVFRILVSLLGKPTMQDDGFAKWKLFKLDVTLNELENRYIVKVMLAK